MLCQLSLASLFYLTDELNRLLSYQLSDFASTDDGGEAVIAIVDVSDPEGVEAMVETAEREFGQMDILVNNIAISDRDHLLDFGVETFDRVMSINLRGTFLGTQATVRSIKDSGG